MEELHPGAHVRLLVQGGPQAFGLIAGLLIMIGLIHIMIHTHHLIHPFITLVFLRMKPPVLRRLSGF